MDEYQRDAYVIDLVTPLPVPDGSTHAVVIDMIDGSRIIHQIVSLVFGKNSAHEQAKTLNQWRDQAQSDSRR